MSKGKSRPRGKYFPNGNNRLGSHLADRLQLSYLLAFVSSSQQVDDLETKQRDNSTSLLPKVYV